MPDALILEFSGVTQEQYDSVNTALGIDPTTGIGDWPSGLISHTGAVAGDGSLLVFELWESQAVQQEFMASRLGPALGQVGVPDPTRAEWRDVVGHHTH